MHWCVAGMISCGVCGKDVVDVMEKRRHCAFNNSAVAYRSFRSPHFVVVYINYIEDKTDNLKAEGLVRLLFQNNSSEKIPKTF